MDNGQWTITFYLSLIVMTSQGNPTSDKSSTEWQKKSPSVESIMPGFNLVLKINRAVRSLILDYTLVAAILGLSLTFSREWVSSEWVDGLGFLALGLLNLKMIRDIRVRWGKPKEQDVFAIASSIFSVLGAFAIAIMANLMVSTMGLFIPLIVVLNRAVGHATLTWALGRATHQFYLSTKRVNSSILKQAIQIQSNPRKKKYLGDKSIN